MTGWHGLLARPLAVFAAALFLAVTLSRAVSSEIFLDGVTYASIARNLALGKGAFWATSYTEFSSPFRMHPPLGFWLQSLAYRAFGDHPWVEFYWGLCCGALTLVGIAALWREAYRGLAIEPSPDAVRQPWWPVVLLLSIPLWSWCLANNLLENTLLVFIVAAVWLVVVALGSNRWTPRLLWAIAAGVLTFGAVLTKGPPGLSILAAPLCAFLFSERVSWRAGLGVSGALALTVLACAGGCLLIGGSAVREFVSGYVEGQLRASIQGAREVASSHAYLVEIFAAHLALPAVALGVLQATFRGPARLEADRRLGLFFVSFALCASVPFLFFRKQMEWYLVPSLPFYALGLAAWFRAHAGRIERWVEASPTRVRAVLGFSGLLALAALIIAVAFPGAIELGFSPTLAGFAQRLKLRPPANEGTSEYCWRNFHRDVLAQGIQLPPDQQVSACARNSDMRVNAYMQRHFSASLFPGAGARYLLLELDSGEPCYLQSDCVPLQREATTRFRLYECPSGGRGRAAVRPPSPQ